jgi:hypothetical protein
LHRLRRGIIAYKEKLDQAKAELKASKLILVLELEVVIQIEGIMFGRGLNASSKTRKRLNVVFHNGGMQSE